MKDWISIEDRLPSCDRLVLMLVSKGPSRFVVNYFVNTDFVTHWMPIPEPPVSQ
jgi:hypothetical protein